MITAVSQDKTTCTHALAVYRLTSKVVCCDSCDERRKLRNDDSNAFAVPVKVAT
jgi:hypothetical protein